LKDFRLTLDGQNFADPLEWQEFSIVKAWEDDVFQQTVELTYTFTGDGYAYIVEQYDAGFCGQIDVRIYICGEDKFNGKIFLSEIEIDRVRCQVVVSIANNNYNAFIKNKADQKYVVNIGRASNGEAITACTEVETDFHDVSTGVYYPDIRRVYDAFDVLEFLVTAMSDGAMGFQSAFFSTGNGYGDTFVTGLELRVPDAANPAPEVSWNEAYGALKKAWNLAIDVVDVSGVQTVVVEPYSYFRNFGVSQAFTGLNSIKESIDAAQLYSVIEIGSSNYRRAEEEDALTTYPNLPYKTWKQESYNIGGSCVVKNTLDLNIQDIIIDNNSIENQLITVVEQRNDTRVFLVRTQEGYSGRETVQYPLLVGDGNYYYNGAYNNESVLANWTNRIHNAPFRFTTGTGADFNARISTSQAVQLGCATTTAYWGDPADTCGYGDAIPFDNVTFDPGGNYNSTDFYYELPTSGTYIFIVDYYVVVTISPLIQSPKGADLVFTLRTHLYEELAAQDIETRDFTFTDFRPEPGGVLVEATKNFFFSHFFVYSGAGGDRVRPYLEFFQDVPLIQLGTTANFILPTEFKSTGFLVSSDSALKTYTGETPILESEWDAITALPYQQVVLNNQYPGHIRRIEWRPFGTSSVELEQVINT